MRLMSDIAADLQCTAAEGPWSKPTDQLTAKHQGWEQGVGTFLQKDTTNLARLVEVQIKITFVCTHLFQRIIHYIQYD